MAVTDRAARVAPYVEQLLEDEGVRENIRQAVDATRQAYGRARAKRRTSQALKDRKVQRRVRDAMQAAGEALTEIARGPQKRDRARRRRTLAALALAGGGLAVALNPQARARALALLGGEDETARDAADPAEEAPGTSGSRSAMGA